MQIRLFQITRILYSPLVVFLRHILFQSVMTLEWHNLLVNAHVLCQRYRQKLRPQHVYKWSYFSKPVVSIGAVVVVSKVKESLQFREGVVSHNIGSLTNAKLC